MSTRSDWFIDGYTVDQCCSQYCGTCKITKKFQGGSKGKIILFARGVQGLFFGKFTGT